MKFIIENLITQDGVKLASGETVLVHDKGTLPLITKGQQVQLNQGTVDSEQVFYRFASPSQEELK